MIYMTGVSNIVHDINVQIILYDIYIYTHGGSVNVKLINVQDIVVND